MSPCVANIADLDVAKQVATLALAENERFYARLEALSEQLAALSDAKTPEPLNPEWVRIGAQMMMLAAAPQDRSVERAATPEQSTQSRFR